MQEETTLGQEQFERDVAELLRRAEDDRRPDRRPPRGHQPVRTVDLERAREELEGILGW